MMQTIAPDPFVNISRGMILNWVSTMYENTTWDTYSVVSPIIRRCRMHFCRSQPWQGNPDLDGIGVSL